MGTQVSLYQFVTESACARLDTNPKLLVPDLELTASTQSRWRLRHRLYRGRRQQQDQIPGTFSSFEAIVYQVSVNTLSGIDDDFCDAKDMTLKNV